MKKSMMNVQAEKYEKIAEVFREKNGYAKTADLKARGSSIDGLLVVTSQGSL